ncbi:DUF711 family protein, partial [Clostridioides difficile]
DELEAIISERTVKYSKDKNILPLFKEDQKEYTSQVIMPIISAVAKEASSRLDVPFGIIDLSLAPTPAIGDSVANILEEMGLEVV